MREEEEVEEEEKEKRRKGEGKRGRKRELPEQGNCEVTSIYQFVPIENDLPHGYDYRCFLVAYLVKDVLCLLGLKA